MDNRESFLKPEILSWLLEEDNPSVRYLALRDLVGGSEGGGALEAAKAKIMTAGPVPSILERQNTAGYWGEDVKFYRDKYRGTAWQVLILAELMADGSDERIRTACEFLFGYSQERGDWGFSVDGTAKNGGRRSEVVPCLTGNMVFALIRLGYLDDERLARAMEWLAATLRTDDGETAPPPVWPYDKLEICYGRHSCFMGVVKTLKALAEIPEASRSAEARQAADRACEFFLAHHIHKRSHDLNRIAKPGWLRFGFPLMYQTDALEILGILTRLGCRDERMREAVDVLIAKRDERGTWNLDNTFNGQFQTDIEEKGKPSKWITLNALRVLKEYFR